MIIAIEDLSRMQDIEPEQQVLIVGGASGGTTPGSVPYVPGAFPTCPLYQYPDGTIGHLCPGEPKPTPTFASI